MRGGHGLGKKKKRTNKIRSEPQENNPVAMWFNAGADDLMLSGYTRLSDNPEVQTAVEKIADMISNMTIYLMKNTENGDVRVKNHPLARKVDIEPNSRMTRKNFISWIVRTMLLGGDGNAIVYPKYRLGQLVDLQPLPPSKVRLVPNGLDYLVDYNSTTYSPDEVIHFAINPDDDRPWLGTGYQLSLRDVVSNLQQAMKTKKGFMGSKYRPSIVIAVDSDRVELQDKQKRKNLVDQYIGDIEAGKPWIFPQDFMKIEQIKPLSLKDLAINENVELDKRTVAGILGIPPYELGVGEYNQKAHNHFVDTKIMSIAQIIQQTLTKDLIEEEDLFFKFNQRSLYQFDIETVGRLALNFANSGKATGNEARAMIGLDPHPDLDELNTLENYIPLEKIGDQKKLN